MKTRRKIIHILVTLSFLMTLLVPMAVPAAAATEYSSLKAPVVDDNAVYELGTVFAKFTAGQLEKGDVVTFRLPSDFIWTTAALGSTESVAAAAYQTDAQWNTFIGGGVSGTSDKYGTENYVEVPKKYSGEENALYSSDGSPVLKFTRLSDEEIQMEVIKDPTPGYDSYFYLYAKRVFVDDGYSGEVTVTFDAPADSGFVDGSVPIGIVSGGEVTVTVSSVDSFSDNDQIKLRITEDRAGALDDAKESLKFKLPSGFVWGSTFTLKHIYGQDLTGILSDADKNNGYLYTDEDELILDLPAGFATTKATSFEIWIDVIVDDETDAKTGDVMAKISGESDVTPSELKVGNYGTYETTIKCEDTPTVYAGMLEQKIGKIVITESVAGSLIDGRTLTLELPATAKWGDLDDDSDNGLDIDITSFPGTDGKTAKFTFKGKSSDAATLELKDMEVVLEPGFTGDLTVKVGGTAGLTGELTVAKVETPVKADASAAPEVKVGGVYEAGDVIITEAAAEAIKKNKYIILDLPQGVRFASAPKVEVIEGDLNIDEDSVKTQKDGEEDDNQVSIYVDSESTVASKIKVSGIKYMVDRTVPEGDIVLRVKGNAVSDVNDPAEVEDYFGTITDGKVNVDGKLAFYVATSGDDKNKVFPKTATATKVVNAKVVTPPQSGFTGTATFVIGQTTYKVNGVDYTMDVAPYIKGDRTFLPVRYVANALGVPDSNIIWNATDNSVMIMKGGTVLKLTIGSTTMLVNGTPFTMDVAPEIVDPGRTMLPVRFVAEALGATVTWDDATQTVTISSK